MQHLFHTPPNTIAEPVTDILHGTEIIDPYRWLEEQNSSRTHKWLENQTLYARSYLDNIHVRERVRARITEFLTISTCEIPRKIGKWYFFAMRSAEQEQPCIYMRNGATGEDILLVDPSSFGGDPYTSVSVSQISSDARLLLYEIKHGGERSGRFEILDVGRRQALPDYLPRGFLRGFTFSPDGKGFYYVHEIIGAKRPSYRAAYYHIFGTQLEADEEIFFAGEIPSLKLVMNGDSQQLCFVKIMIGEQTPTEYYLYNISSRGPARLAFRDEGHLSGIAFWQGCVFAMTDSNAPNRRIVKMTQDASKQFLWREVIPESSLQMTSFTISEAHILVQYVDDTKALIRMFDLNGTQLHEATFPEDGTIVVQLTDSTPREIFYKYESFRKAPAIYRYLSQKKEHQIFAQTKIPFDSTDVVSTRVSYRSKDGTLIPMYLVGKGHVSPGAIRPTILTGYGGFGTAVTPKFGVFTSFMIEQGCLFALANLRGGSGFGKEWHLAARGRNRQKAFDDFISAAQWLIVSGYTTPEKLAIFGGSNSGLLVGAALTQRPDLFRAVVCLGPLLDMLRYHRFDFARKYRAEYGIAEDPDDYAALRAYSPYHHIKEGVAYPAVLLVSGDMDMNCNPMHARKMTARLQAASASEHPILLDYKPFRGHKPMMPLSERIEGLTDRLSFLCDQLGIPLDSVEEQSETEANR